jgi:hypothetical protein
MVPVTSPRWKLIVLTLGAVALLWPATAESPVGAAAAPSVPEVASVTVEHELIQVTAAAPVQPRLPSSPTVRLAAGPARSIKTGGFAVRAGRALMGDGRYRPEPFPRPGRR